MKKSIYSIFLFVCCSFISLAQSKDTLNVFYSTYEDYINGTPVPGIKYNNHMRVVFGYQTISVIRGNKTENVNVKNLPYWGFVNDIGQLVRIYKGYLYDVIAHGKMCSYIKSTDAMVVLDKNENKNIIYEAMGYMDYYSESPDEDLRPVNSDLAIVLMFVDRPKLAEEFIDDTGFHEVDDERINRTYKIAAYINTYNEN